jgi:putative restriction endonuclease
MDEASPDAVLRLAAVEHLKRVSAGGVLSSDDLKAGFVFEGSRVPLINPQRGIFKPAAMRYLLSVRTVFPVSGRKVWYDDQRQVHGQIERGDELIDYAFMGSDPDAADNRWLREARDAEVPEVTKIAEKEIHEAVITCTKARQAAHPKASGRKRQVH